jgi:hypothetical protein
MCPRFLDQSNGCGPFHGLELVDLILQGPVARFRHGYAFHRLLNPASGKKTPSGVPCGPAGPELL